MAFQALDASLDACKGTACVTECFGIIGIGIVERWSFVVHTIKENTEVLNKSGRDSDLALGVLCEGVLFLLSLGCSHPVPHPARLQPGERLMPPTSQPPAETSLKDRAGARAGSGGLEI